VSVPGKPAGIILAAGASRRMGAVKALVRFQGESLVDRAILAMGAAATPVIVVLGHHAEAIREGALRGGEAMWVVNSEPERGQLSSLQCGLRAVPAEAPAAIFTPVDYPAVQPDTIRRIAGALGDGALLSVPRCQGRRGHPVGIGRALFGEFLALPAGGRASDVVARHQSEIRYVDVDDAGILDDADDAEALRGLIERIRR
jgi:molybdenum cofactor cytidylyltransferase